MSKTELINLKDIQRKILTVRNNQVMLDSDLALFYGIETKMLNRAVKRNIERFPENFIFKLTFKEWESLRFQNGTSNNESPLRFQNGTLKENNILRSQNVTLDNDVFLRSQNAKSGLK
ncbi:MAG TPA: ORF6N domain-containing protein [Ignavibacteria bacterium]